MSGPLVAALFGVGGRVGKAVALKFLENGYQVAAVSRSGAPSLQEEAEKHKGMLRQYQADLSRSEDAVRVWKEIRKDFDSPISVVFYNAATVAPVDGGKILDVSVEAFRASIELNTVTTFALAKEAVSDFDMLPQSTSKSFIYTGNALNDPQAFPRTPPGLFTLQIGKTSSASIIDAASQVYGPQGYKFYYIDERIGDEGAPAYNKITGSGHADIVWSLSQEAWQSDWRVPFVDGKGRI